MVNRQANKLWFLVKVVPQIKVGDVKVCEWKKMLIELEEHSWIKVLVSGGSCN